MIAGSWKDLLAASGLALIQELLPAYLVRQRWFGAKSRTIASVRVKDWVEMPGVGCGDCVYRGELCGCGCGGGCVSAAAGVELGGGGGGGAGGSPGSILASLNTGDGPAVLHDATAREDFRQGLLGLIEREEELEASGGAAMQSGLESQVSESRLGHPDLG